MSVFLFVFIIHCFVYFLCMSVFSAQISVHSVHAWCLKRPLDHLELELYVVISHYVGAMIQTQVLWKSS